MEAKQQKSWKWTKGKIILCVLLAIVVLAAGIIWYLYAQVASAFDPGSAGVVSQVQDEDIAANGERFYNLLLIGIDYDADDDGRDYAAGKGMTDVILYMQIDRDTNKINILQIPRDTYIGEEDGEGVATKTGKLNEVYANGPDQENLINNLTNKIYDLFKLPVDNYVMIDMQAFRTLLDTMGGIKMYVPWDIVAVDKTTGAEELIVTQGTHWVSGETAEAILRNRNYATADYQRLETQQYFYAALVRTFLQDYKLADYYAACKNIAHYLSTDLAMTDIWGLYATMTEMDPSNIFVIRAPGGGTTYGGHKGLYGVNRDKMADILNEYFRDETMPVDAEKLGLATGFDYPYGETEDPGKTLGSVDSGAGEAQ